MDFCMISDGSKKISFGDVLCCFRIANNLEQKDVADILGIHFNSIIALERNNKGMLGMVENLACIYKISVEDIYYLYRRAYTNKWDFYQTLNEAIKLFSLYQGNENEWSKEITLGKIIKYFRNVNQLYMKDVAEKLNISKSSVSLLENDKRKIDDKNLEGFAVLFGVNVEDFYIIQKKANNERWSYQRLLLEILKILFNSSKSKECFDKDSIKTNPIVIRAFRTFYNVSQEELSSKMGYSLYQIKSIENGNRSLSKQSLEAFCQAFDLESKDVIRIQNEAEEKEWSHERIMLEIALNWNENKNILF